MTEAQAKQAIFNAWLAAWDGGAHAAVPTSFENEPGTASTAWCRVSMRHTRSEQVSFGPVGSRRFERDGYIVVNLFTPVDDGGAEISGLADDARIILEATSFGSGEPVRTYAGQTQESPTDGTWNQLTVLVPFEYFETR